MGLLKRFLAGSSSNKHGVEMMHRFGRYSDAYKTAAQYKAWDTAVEEFESGAFLASVEALMSYLRDDDQDNVFWQRVEGRVTFEFFQGSRRIRGIADEQHVRAESTLAHAQKWNVALLRRLVEQNFGFSYIRYAIDAEGNVLAVFDSFSLDASPYKLYYALKELATQADKQDDLLLDEFSPLQMLSQAPTQPLPEEEMGIKYQYIKSQVAKVLDFVHSGKLDKDRFPGGIGYLWLHLLYKLDYLTQPQGYLMEMLERIHRLYFSNDENNTARKNVEMEEAFCRLVRRPEQDFYREMYRVSSTFGITTPVDHAHVAGFIASELPNMDWYYAEGFPEVALAVPGFITGYCLFNYAPPQPVRDLLHLYYRITEGEFFRALGMPGLLSGQSAQIPDKREIIPAIRKCMEGYRQTHPQFLANLELLQFDDMPLFARSFLLMVAEMDTEKV